MSESFGSCGVGGIEDDLAGGSDLVGAAVVNVAGGVEPDAGVAVVVVVVLEERVAERPGVVEAGEALRERRRVLQRLELGFRSEEHTSELQSLMRSSYAVFC